MWRLETASVTPDPWPSCQHLSNCWWHLSGPWPSCQHFSNCWWHLCLWPLTLLPTLIKLLMTPLSVAPDPLANTYQTADDTSVAPDPLAHTYQTADDTSVCGPWPPCQHLSNCWWRLCLCLQIKLHRAYLWAAMTFQSFQCHHLVFYSVIRILFHPDTGWLDINKQVTNNNSPTHYTNTQTHFHTHPASTAKFLTCMLHNWHQAVCTDTCSCTSPAARDFQLAGCWCWGLWRMSWSRWWWWCWPWPGWHPVPLCTLSSPRPDPARWTSTWCSGLQPAPVAGFAVPAQRTVTLPDQAQTLRNDGTADLLVPWLLL